MGYYTYITGEARIAPAIPVSDLAEFADVNDGDTYFVAKNEGEEETIGLDAQGNITVVPGNQVTILTSRYDEPIKAYDVGTEVLRLAEMAKAAGSKMNGAFYLDGEESLDLTRVRIKDNKIFHQSPDLVWPDGEKGWGQ